MREATICLQLVAVADGLHATTFHALIPAIADTAAAAWETCAHGPRTSARKEIRHVDRSTHDVCAADIASANSSAHTARYAMTRDRPSGCRRWPSAIPNSGSHAGATAGQRSGGGVRRRVPLHPSPAPRLARPLPRHALEHVHLDPGRVRTRVPHTRHHRAARRAQPPERRSRPKPGRCAADDPVGAGGRRARHAAARSPDRRRRRPLLQLPRSRNAHAAARGGVRA